LHRAHAYYALSWGETLLTSGSTRAILAGVFTYVALGLDYGQKTPLLYNTAPILYCLAGGLLLQAYGIEFHVRRSVDGLGGALLSFLGAIFSILLIWSSIVLVIALFQRRLIEIEALPAFFFASVPWGMLAISYALRSISVLRGATLP